MKIESAINKLTEQCDIYYKNICISREPIVRDFLRFFSKAFNQSEKRVSFSLNTGSVVFDMVAVVATVISSLGYNENTNDNIIDSFSVGDIVIYDGKRYTWNGIVEQYNNTYISLGYDNGKINGKGTRQILYEKNKYAVKAYHGKSKVTDGRGIRNKKSNREDFFSYIYDVRKVDVPSAIDASFVVVAEKNFSEVLKDLSIKYESKSVGLFDLVACSYYTNGLEETVIGSNPSKKEPVIKLTSHISTGRELALRNDGNKIAGVIVLVSSDTSCDNSELLDLIGRKKIKFLHYMTRYDTSYGEYIVKEYTNASVFACTPSYLLEIEESDRVNKKNIVNDLNKQINNLAKLDVEEVIVDSDYTFETIRNIKDAIFAVKDSGLDDESINDFIMNTMTLLNLFMSAPFRLKVMEKCIVDNKLHIGVISPAERIKKLEKQVGLFGSVEAYAKTVVDFLKNEYEKLLDDNRKENSLEIIIRRNIKKRIAIIVPKAYYRDVLKSSSIFGINTSNVFIETAKGFNPDNFYDVIIAVGDIDGSRFKVFECCSASKVYMLLYNSENKIFSVKKRKAKVFEGNIYNKHKKYSYVIDERIEKEEIKNTQEIEEVETDFDNLANYIDGLKYVIPSRYSTYSDSESGTSVSEVSYVGFFESGERIFMSKYYSAVVYDEIKGVDEKNADKLQAGDVIVFTRNDSYTKNIVDYIFEELLEQNKLNDSVKEAFEKSERWKKLLRDYKEDGEYTYRDIADALNEIGLDYGEVAIRQWIIPESHIVGPRKAEVISIIGKLVYDEDMINNYNMYDEAFKLVRKHRRKILGLISRAINDKLSGKHASGDEIIQTVFDNVDKLSETYELESIQKLEEPLFMPVGIVNRPVDVEDVGV